MSALPHGSATWRTEQLVLAPIENRQKQMDVHGAKGRRWAGKVLQIISGSIGFDDWEWPVDLFSNNPFTSRNDLRNALDEVSAEYSNFGIFMVGVGRRSKTSERCSREPFLNLTHLP